MSIGFTLVLTGDKEAAQALAARGADLASERPLRLVGSRWLAWIDENFRRGGAETPWRPLSPNTLAARRTGKGGRGVQILRDTGRLAQSFTVKVSAGAVRVGTKHFSAAWHHAGTRPYEIRPRRKKFLFFQTAAGLVFARRVQHPGLPARPILPSPRLAGGLATETLLAYLKRVVELGRG